MWSVFAVPLVPCSNSIIPGLGRGSGTGTVFLDGYYKEISGKRDRLKYDIDGAESISRLMHFAIKSSIVKWFIFLRNLILDPRK